MQKLPSAMASDILPQDNVGVSFLDYGEVAQQELIIWGTSKSTSISGGLLSFENSLKVMIYPCAETPQDTLHWSGIKTSKMIFGLFLEQSNQSVAGLLEQPNISEKTQGTMGLLTVHDP